MLPSCAQPSGSCVLYVAMPSCIVSGQLSVKQLVEQILLVTNIYTQYTVLDRQGALIQPTATSKFIKLLEAPAHHATCYLTEFWQYVEY